MSDISANIVVETNPITIQTETNPIGVTVEPITLSVYAGGYATAGGNSLDVQYNFGGILAGSNAFTFNPSTNTISAVQISATGNIQTTANITANANISAGSTINSVNGNITSNLAVGNNQTIANNLSVGKDLTVTSNLTVNSNTVNFSNTSNVTLGAVANLHISGGTANYFLQTDGAGNLTWAETANANLANFAITANFANYAGNVTVSNQPNITSIGNLTALTVTGNAEFTGANVSLGNVSNLQILGGNNGFVLQTDGTGNLTWTAQTGNAGNGSPGGSNTQIQYNDAGNFGGSVGFTFDNTSNLFSAPGNANIVGNVNAGNVNASGYIGNKINLSLGIENVSLIGAQTGTYNFDLLNNTIRYTTANATANVTLNFRGNSSILANTLLGNGQSITATYVMLTDTTPYAVTGIQIDGSAQTIKWVSNITPLLVANTLNAYTFTIVKTSTSPTYDVLGSSTRYG